MDNGNIIMFSAVNIHLFTAVFGKLSCSLRLKNISYLHNMLLRVSLPVGFGLLMVAGIVRTENATEKPKERRYALVKTQLSVY